MALRKKKNQRLCEEEEESKGLCEEEEEETATERERVAGEKESSVFFLK